MRVATGAERKTGTRGPVVGAKGLAAASEPTTLMSLGFRLVGLWRRRWAAEVEIGPGRLPFSFIFYFLFLFIIILNKFWILNMSFTLQPVYISSNPVIGITGLYLLIFLHLTFIFFSFSNF
jgi:hypothetical protein